MFGNTLQASPALPCCSGVMVGQITPRAASSSRARLSQFFEAYAIERFPPGEEPKTEWVYAEATQEKWGLVLSQDFSNMAAVQRGMHSRGFRGTLPNPHQERKVTNFHRVLADVMGAGHLHLLDK